nr:MAG TPA: hypothetical protein [Caudoviricetes sp.]
MPAVFFVPVRACVMCIFVSENMFKKVVKV